MEKDSDYNSPDDEAYSPPESSARDRGPSVAAPKGKNFVVLGIFILMAGLIMYLFIGGKGDDIEVEEDDEVVTTTIQSQPSQLQAPSFSDDIIAPPPPPAPPEIDIDAELEAVNEEDDEELIVTELQDPKKKKRYQTNMLITGGVFSTSDLTSGSKRRKPQQDVYDAANQNDPNVGFADSYYNQDSVPSAFARKLGNTSRLITQGKIIDAVLETPINTEVPGMIRGIVSRDVYGESGRIILVPKGSRLLGTYNNLVVRGNKRVNVIWSRVIRPDGIDIMIRSPGTSQLGTAGIEGVVDNKYLEVFSTAFLVSAINIALAVGVDALDDEKSQTTQNTDGSSTSTTNAKTQAALKAVDLFGNAADNLIKSAYNTAPTITIEQGTRISVFVNRDLVFPGELINQVQIIQ